MIKKNERTKLIIVTSFGVLDTLPTSPIGPITKPFRATVNDIMHLVNTGKDVYEVSDDGKHRVKLTTRNYDSNNQSLLYPKPKVEKTEIKEEPVPVEEEKEEEKPSGKVQNSVKYYNNNNNTKQGKKNK